MGHNNLKEAGIWGLKVNPLGSPERSQGGWMQKPHCPGLKPTAGLLFHCADPNRPN